MYDLQEQFYQVMTRLRANSGSRAAASVSEPREWYYDKNGVMVSKPVESKAGSVTTTRRINNDVNVNKAKVIADFIAKGY